MKRDRQQKGSVVRIGEFWCLRYADWRIETGQRIRKQGLTHKLSAVLPEHCRLKHKPEYVGKVQREFMNKVNSGRNAPERCATVAQFVDDVWLPFIGNRHSSSTLNVYNFYWNQILKPPCGDKLLRDFNTPLGQALLDEVARQNPTMRAGTLHKLKSILSAVFKLAVQQDYRPGPNPMRETTLPKALGVQETHAYDLQTIRGILALVPNKCRVIIALAAYAGLSEDRDSGLGVGSLPRHRVGDSVLRPQRQAWRAKSEGQKGHRTSHRAECEDAGPAPAGNGQSRKGRDVSNSDGHAAFAA